MSEPWVESRLDEFRLVLERVAPKRRHQLEPFITVTLQALESGIDAAGGFRAFEPAPRVHIQEINFHAGNQTLNLHTD